MSERPAMVEAAVLAPVYRDVRGRIHLVLVHRADRGVHGGQLALPGGRREPEDADLRATALRETEEEIGLRRESVDVLAALPIVTTSTTGFHIAPFLGRLMDVPGVWMPHSPEIVEVLDITLDELSRPGVHTEESLEFPGWSTPRVVPFYRVGPHRLWGATYRIVHPLLHRLVAGEWPL